MSVPNQAKINDVLGKIDREKKLAAGATNLRKKTSNAQVIQKCNMEIRQAQKNIEYLEATLQKLVITTSNHVDKIQNSSLNVDIATQQPAFTALDLLKYECPSLGHKIQYMMQLLEFKIQVEEQYREANEKMYNLYQVDGDKSSIAIAEGGRVESDQKLQLMKRALKQYQSMYIDIDDVSRENATINNFRKNPLSGVLSIQVQTVRNVDHIQSPLFSRTPESFVVIKIDDNEKARTKGSRNDHWADSFDIKVENSNELSITICDKIGDQILPVGLCWLPLSDVSEEIRRKKIAQERGDADNWISASSIQHKNNNGETTTKSISGSFENDLQVNATTNRVSSNNNRQLIKSSCWFNIEPHGEILLTLSFVKSTDTTRRHDINMVSGGLGRQGAIRQRKEEVVEAQGHKFVQKQFYNVMSCAVCGDFLRYTGFQCEDCRFLCHQKCIKNVIAKCISTSSAEIDTNEAKLNHKIPHRFLQVTNRGAKWCCHCGYILPFSKKNVRKCSECGIMCHAGCAHLVPDLCGIPTKAATKILEAIKSSQKYAHTKQKSKQLTETPQIQKLERVERHEPRGISKLEDDLIMPNDTGYPSKAVRRASLEFALDPFNIENDHTNKQSDKNFETPVVEKVQSNSENISARRQTAHSAHQKAHRRHRTDKEKRPRKKRYGLDDFKFISVLGKGNFGKVMLAEYVDSRRLCAIKVLKKNFIIENDEVESTKSEKRVFLTANQYQHPFLLNLYQCFQTENRIYFVMEYMSGGDLMWHVQQKRFSLRRSQFYAAEVLLALKFLHEHGIIYRDLKLDNILLTTDGHVKLADYGLCKEKMWFGNTTRTFCGTPELMAPEIILEDQEYGKAVDWWAFGVLLYQMILTKTPFKGEDEEEVFNAILTDEPLYPISMAKESVDIIQKLLCRNPKQRLGYSERDALEIMEQPYFDGINFDDILNCKVEPPYVPNIKDPRDAQCFEEEFTSQAAKLTPVNSILSPEYQEMFRGFTYTCEDMP